MRPSRRRSPGSRRLTLLFVVVLLPPALALVWLGAALLDQDRAMLAERGLERREAAADRVTAALLQSMREAERSLVEDVGVHRVPDGMVRVTRSSAGFDVYPADRVLWVPEPPRRREAAAASFADAERAEIEGTGDRGLSQYESLARSPDVAVRAGALIRLARTHRRAGRRDQAVRAYRELATIHDVDVDRTPVDLVARRMLCELVGEAGRKDDLGREAAALGRDLFGQRWLLDRAAWELAASDVTKWTGVSTAMRDSGTLSSAVDWAYAEWRQLSVAGRRIIIVDDTPVTMMWRTNGSELRVLAIAAMAVDRWVRAAVEREPPASLHVSLVTESGRLVAGDTQKPGTRSIARSSSESGLPWTLLVATGDVSLADAELLARRRLLGAGLAALVLLLAGGSYLLWRIVQRELAVARLQTDFVAAVSHEFRTPLTSLRHITGLLEESDELPPGRRQSLYSVLSQSTDRLHRLVESLLDFARMEDGRKPWKLRSVDLSGLVSDLVASFRKEHAGVTIQMDIPEDGPVIHADADALTHALWNLLDNAVKYSPAGAVIRVTVREDASNIAIAVSDQGLGIPSDERQEIFQRFVRGRQAVDRGIAGTGLGLAMVSHIVSVHGGRIGVESNEGDGSTFTILLPANPIPVKLASGPSPSKPGVSQL
jgi:two-component system phosphate regulon sensor histidine kinase PhoR